MMEAALAVGGALVVLVVGYLYFAVQTIPSNLYDLFRRG